MKRAALVLVAALALPAPAAAKEPIRATICGASACTTVTDRATLNRIPGGERTAPLGPAAPYYTVEVVAGEPGHPENQHSFSMYYVPSQNGMAWAENGTVRLHPIFGEPTTQLMRDLTAKLRPFPARPSPWPQPRPGPDPPSPRLPWATLGLSAVGALLLASVRKKPASSRV